MKSDPILLYDRTYGFILIQQKAIYYCCGMSMILFLFLRETKLLLNQNKASGGCQEF